MLIERLKVSGFRSIKDTLELEFPEGIIGLFGENESGKTSLLDAIFVGLYGFPKGKAKTERDAKNNLVNWEKKRATLTVDFKIGEDKFRINRSFTNKNHKCELYQFDGVEYKLISNNITEISDYIIEISGMDRDSFAKLVYIRQKDLDTLVELDKKSRESMLNKVMGIEIFDTITKKAKEDRKKAKIELEITDEHFKQLTSYLEEKKCIDTEIEELETKIKDRKKEIKNCKAQLEKHKNKLQQLRWLKKEKELKEKINLNEKQLEQIQLKLQKLQKLIERKLKLEKDLKPLKGIEERVEILEEIRDNEKEKSNLEKKIDTFKHEIEQLKERKKGLTEFKNKYYDIYETFIRLKNEIKEIHIKINILEESIESIDNKLNEVVRLYEVSTVEEVEEKYRIIQKNYPIIRNKFIYSISGFIAGLMVLIPFVMIEKLFPFLAIPILIIVGSSVLGYYTGKNYLLIRKQKMIFNRYEMLKNERAEKEEKIREKNTEISAKLEEHKLKTVNALDNQIDTIQQKLVKKFNFNNFEALNIDLQRTTDELSNKNTILQNNKEQLSSIVTKLSKLYEKTGKVTNLTEEIKEGKKQIRRKSKLEGELKEVSSNVKQLEKENLKEKEQQFSEKVEKLKKDYTAHINKKPEMPSTLAYSEKEENKVQKIIENLNEQFRELDGAQKADEREKSNKIKRRNELINLLMPYDEVKKRKYELENELKVLGVLINEIKEISMQLRNRVLPVAKMKINQILPILTKNRYSSLEISDDLKFTVYNLESKDLKPRELFSGGTQDQFLIALRLAFTESIITSRISSEKFSLLMDECISSSDEYRREQIFNILKASKNTFKQIFIVAHEDISNYVEYYLELGINDNSSTTIVAKSW